MTCEQFYDAMWDFVDTWVPTVDAADYAEMLDRLDRRVLRYQRFVASARVKDFWSRKDPELEQWRQSRRESRLSVKSSSKSVVVPGTAGPVTLLRLRHSGISRGPGSISQSQSGTNPFMGKRQYDGRLDFSSYHSCCHFPDGEDWQSGPRRYVRPSFQHSRTPAEARWLAKHCLARPTMRLGGISLGAVASAADELYFDPSPTPQSTLRKAQPPAQSPSPLPSTTAPTSTAAPVPHSSTEPPHPRPALADASPSATPSSVWTPGPLSSPSPSPSPLGAVSPVPGRPLGGSVWGRPPAERRPKSAPRYVLLYPLCVWARRGPLPFLRPCHDPDGRSAKLAVWPWLTCRQGGFPRAVPGSARLPEAEREPTTTKRPSRAMEK